MKMGMFDIIKNFEIECPTCGKLVTEFQTKDTACNMEYVDYWETDYFYSPCDYCDTWIDFVRKRPMLRVPIEDYKMIVTKSDGLKKIE